MSGLYGHMNHLYEDPTLTFGELKEIFNKASNGLLEGTEKTDGQNIYFSYSIKDSQVKAARNKSNILLGGINKQQLLELFNNENVKASYSEAFDVFENYVKKLSIEQQMDLFGTDADVFYNTEIQNPNTSNVFLYDNKTLNIHRSGHLELDKRRNQIIEKTNRVNFSKLEEYLKQNQVPEYNIILSKIRKVNPFTDRNRVNEYVQRLEKEQKSFNLSDNENVGNYILSSVKKRINEQFPSFNLETKNLLIRRMIGNESVNVNSVIKSIPNIDLQLKEQIKTFVRNDKQFIKEILSPIENIVHDFSIDVLKEFYSDFIKDHQKENERIKTTFSKVIESISNSGIQEAIEVMNKNLSKINDISNIVCFSEGIVFEHNNKTYKLTGHFAPVNQIMGLYNYGRGKIPPIKNLFNEKQTAQNIGSKTSSQKFSVALYPGSFKPPHAGHLNSAIKALENSHRVLLFISPKDRDGITSRQSKELWELYISRLNLKNKIIPMIVEKSPINSVYDYIESSKPGESIKLIVSEKDAEEHRFNNAINLRNDIIVEKQITPEVVGISSTQIRQSIKDNNFEQFRSNFPNFLTEVDGQQIWKYLSLSVHNPTGNGDLIKKKLNRLEEDFKYMIDRKDFLNELKLRTLIQKNLKVFHETKKQTYLAEEKRLRNIIQKLIKEAVDEDPHDSTGINVLEDLLKKIIPVLEKDYKKLTTSPLQRKSFRSHILNAVKNSLAPEAAMDDSDNIHEGSPVSLDINVDQINDPKNDQELDPESKKFIDIGRKTAKPKDEIDTFSIPGEDETGKNVALKSFQKIEKNIVDSFSMLSDPNDKTVFYDYLLTNLKLYFSRFDSELQNLVPEPDSPEGSEIQTQEPSSV